MGTLLQRRDIESSKTRNEPKVQEKEETIKFNRKRWTKQLFDLLIKSISKNSIVIIIELLLQMKRQKTGWCHQQISPCYWQQFFYSKKESMLVSEQHWRSYCEEEYWKVNVRQLKQWIKNTNRLLKSYMPNIHTKKITNFFPNNKTQK